MRVQGSIFGSIAIAVLLAFSNCVGTAGNKKVTIAAAANTQYVMEVIVQKFKEKTGIDCNLIIGSSGKLTAQIVQGAPYDVFIAADMKYPEEIVKSGLALKTPESYGFGQLVLWTMKEGIEPSLSNLTDASVHHIALANPITAPYGRAAMEVLNQHGLYDSLSHKLVYGESISQTNQFIISRSAELGFTAMSVVLSPRLKGQGKWSAVNSTFHAPIEQGAVLINRGEANTAEAKRFYVYLFSDEAKMLLKNFGYLVDE